MDFSGCFSAETEEKIYLRISCDSVYTAYVNGKIAGFAACAYYPEHRNFRAIIEEHNVLEHGKTVLVKGKYVAAQVVPNGEILKLTYENGYTGITLPRIVGYAMIMLKK